MGAFVALGTVSSIHVWFGGNNPPLLPVCQVFCFIAEQIRTCGVIGL